MRRLTTGLSLAIVLASLAPVATAGMYGRIEAGVSSGDVSGVITDLPLGGFLGLASDPDSSTETGFTGFAVLGVDLVGNLSLEGELGYSNLELSPQTDVSQLTVMANAVFTVDVAPAIDLVLGAGIGLDNYAWDSYSPFAIGATELSDTGVAYQGIVGLDVGVGGGVDLSVRYRYRVAEVDIVGASVNYGAATALAKLDSLDSHSVTVGLKFDF